MKHTILLMLVLLGVFTRTQAEDVSGVSVRNLAITREGDYMSVGFLFDLSDLHVGDNRAVLLTPRVIQGTDSVNLSSVGVYGRRRYYYYVRNGEGMLTGGDERSYRKSEKPDTMSYQILIPYNSWMNGASLLLYRGEYGCCNTLLAEETALLGDYSVFDPEWVFVRPNGDGGKTFSLSGSAYVDFPVDQTVIYPDYRRNEVELQKIFSSIDSIRNDEDITIKKVWLKGYASPESPYRHNTELAIGRTAALKKYISQLYHFEDRIIETDYEPEDWAGLREYVAKGNLDHRQEILEIIDEPLDPDEKEAKIRRLYPADYKFLLQHCYPALRHTDYRIDYIVRRYTDIEEIRRLIKTRPQKLSQNEFYLLAQSYESGSDEFNEVFEIAVKMYPNDTLANLNAANTAMQRKDLQAAERYLAKSGNSKEAIYARGIYAILQEDYTTAEELMRDAKAAGITQADGALRYIWNKTKKTINTNTNILNNSTK